MLLFRWDYTFTWNQKELIKNNEKESKGFRNMSYYQILEDPASPQKYSLENVGGIDSISPLVKMAAVLIPKHILSSRGKQGKKAWPTACFQL